MKSFYYIEPGPFPIKQHIFAFRTPELSEMVPNWMRRNILQVLINGTFGPQWANISKNDLRIK